MEIIREGRLTERVKAKIFVFYFKNLDQDDLHDDAFDISSLIIEINDENFVKELIEKIPIFSKVGRLYHANFNGILAGYSSGNIIDLLISIANDKTKNLILRECCSEALSKTRGVVAIDVFFQLILDDNPMIRQNAVIGLNRFPTYQIKDILFAQIDDLNGFVQNSLIELIGERGLLVELIDAGRFPKILYDVTVQTFLRKIRKFNICELYPFIIKIYQEEKNERLLIDFAFTFYTLGDSDIAKKIIENFYINEKFVFLNYGLADLIEISPNFESEYAFNLVKRSWNSIDDSKDKGNFYRNLCIDALQQIGTQDAIIFLKDKAEHYAEMKSILMLETIFRSLNRIASVKDEDWYIYFINKYEPFINIDLHRIIEGIGQIGTEKSERVIKEISNKYKDDEYIINICYFSLERIKLKSGKFIMVCEEDLLF